MNERVEKSRTDEVTPPSQAAPASQSMFPPIHGGLLQRKVARRLQRRAEAGAEASAPAVAAPSLTPVTPGVIQRKGTPLPQGEQGFDKLWGAHPHNYQEDESQNTSSEDLLDAQGLPSWIQNTCATRLSAMLNNSGYDITPQKCAAAGIRPPTFAKKSKKYFILAASEMWQYLSVNFRKADKTFPLTGKYADAEKFQAAYDSEIKPIVSARKGIVAFEKIFGYSGTGHVDLFDGEHLSDAPGWYPSTKLHLWYVVVP